MDNEPMPAARDYDSLPKLQDFENDPLRTWEPPSAEAEVALKKWAGEIPVVFVGPDKGIPIVSRANLAGPNSVRIISGLLPYIVSGVTLPPNAISAWVAGGVLQTDQTIYLMPPTPVGSGGMYDIYCSVQLRDGANYILRIFQPSKPTKISDRDHSVLAYANRHNLPGVPLLERKETMPDRTCVFVIREPSDARSAYKFVEPDELPADKLFRLVELQLFEFKAWLKAGLVYQDWQYEELVRVKRNADFDDFQIIGHRQLDFQPLASCPTPIDLVDQIVDLEQRISDSLTSSETIASAEKIIHELKICMQELDALRAGTTAYISDDQIRAQAKINVKQKHGFIASPLNSLFGLHTREETRLKEESRLKLELATNEYEKQSPALELKIKDLTRSAHQALISIDPDPTNWDETILEKIKRVLQMTSDSGRKALVDQIVRDFGAESPLAAFIEIECPEATMRSTDTVSNTEIFLSHAGDRLNVLKQYMNDLQYPNAHSSKMAVMTFIKFRIKPLVRKVMDKALQEKILAYVYPSVLDALSTDQCVEILDTVLTHVGSALGVSRLPCGKTEYDAVFLTE